MTDRQVELINGAHSLAAQAKRELDLLLEGMASGMEGKLLSADTDRRLFNVELPDEVPDTETTAEKIQIVAPE